MVGNWDNSSEPSQEKRTYLFKQRTGGRSLGKNASIRSIKRYCSEIWAELIKIRDNYSCVLCGETSQLNSHHLISRKYLPAIYNINNGITLCVNEHKWDILSAHNCPLPLYLWLEKNRKEQYDWFLQEIEKVKKSQRPYEVDYEVELYKLIDLYQNANYKDFQLSRYHIPKKTIANKILYEYVTSPSENIATLVKRYDCSRDFLRNYILKNGIKIKKVERPDIWRPILQLNENGSIREFKSATEAAEILKISVNGIYNCLRNKSKTSHGYKWSYKDEEELTEKCLEELEK